ncbi:MAG: SRPBCC family protein [Hydrogenophaga sp.]|uniref:SRPBCC family protein n=1 Tax=Hydrogenophaga sp. TaxID=1904254 RepID=UPI00273767D1|nr:SRPBCC family protein [Hydrogenophaga sp.]MDP3344227.1 SRPBCC family protein [Hydrogenophaga sp.]MDP3807419.1 SRPBCC family protein [Hydrogenophaga sp.]MDP3925014.1 SRPBCC family protein [Hydrogenophaga sp.]
MEVKLDKRYPLDVDPARAWAILADLKAVAGCMPGAELTEQLSDTSYKGGVKVKVGPAVAQFGGTVDVLEKSEADRKMVLRGKGADKGGSSASMDLTAVIEADPANPAHSVLHGDAAVIVNGKFAQFGGRMMVQVSEMILVQFVENFRQAALALPAPASVAMAEDAAVAFGGAAEAAQAAPVAAAAPRTAPPVAQEINGLAIVWALIKNWWLGLFGKKT